MPLKFSALTDTGCEGITPTGSTELGSRQIREPSPAATNSAVGTYTNKASIEGNEGTGTKKSNKVMAKVPAEPSFTIEKQQRSKGELSYGAGELTGKFGQTVEYEITVKNTGNVALKFSALTDPGAPASPRPAQPN